MAISAAYGPARICVEEHALCSDERRADLTPRELELLQLLVARPDAVVGKQQLLDAIGGTPMAGYRDRRVDVHIAAIRRKFRQVAPGWEFIHTRVGVGYRFAAEPRR
jgi:DNA-binding response OmpR family regulator